MSKGWVLKVRAICACAVGLMAVVLFGGCGRLALFSAPATPVVVTRVVEVTRVVTVEVTRVAVVTRVVTMTPTPTPTMIPTRAPTVTPTPAMVMAPAGWVTYTHPAGTFWLLVPGDARVNRETVDTTTFEFPGQVGVVVALAAGPVMVGDEEAISDLVRGVLGVQSSLDTVRVLGRGWVMDPLRANYVDSSVKDYVSEVVNYRLDLAAPLTGTRSLRGVLLRHGRAVTEADRRLLGTMLGTLRVR